MRILCRSCVVIAALAVCATHLFAAQEPRTTLRVTVTDENGVALASARVVLLRPETQTTWKCETDHAGRCTLADLPRVVCQLRVEKDGFYAIRLDEVRAGETDSVEVTLNHLQEFAERVEVAASSAGVDPAKTESAQNLGSREIVNLPYTVTRDIRTALPLLPGVLPGAGEQVHVHGSAPQPLFVQLDDFRISAPASGFLTLRVNTDALRGLDVQGSRSSAQYGKGSAGVLTFATGMGDDRFRFSATDFIPSLQNRKGIRFNNWTPRAVFSGPLRQKRAWFLLAPEGEYGLDIVEELPSGQDRLHTGRFSHLAKAQVNLNPGNILTATFLINRFHADHAGLSPFDPLETTRELSTAAEFFSVKQQSYFAGGLLLEVGLAASRFRAQERPMGTLPYLIRPDGTAGNFSRRTDGRSRRLQWLANVYLRPAHWRGRHELKLGADIERLTYHQFFDRRPISVLRADGTLARAINFSGPVRFSQGNLEVSGYAQDRWSPTERLLVELGARFDWDHLLRRASFSPRLASTYLLSADGNSKLAAGLGLYHDPTNLELLCRPLAGTRTDAFFASDGQTPLGPPLVTSLQAEPRSLQPPRVLNWSLGVERLFRGSTLLRVEFLQKRGRNGLAYLSQGAPASGLFVLQNLRRDRYDAFQISLRHTFRKEYSLLVSYTRSAARSNTLLDFDLDNPVFGAQAGGRLPWDAPNRLLSWGWLPLPKRFLLAYTLDWRDGYPFLVVNQNQQLVGPPNARRFPDFFSLSVHLERRFRFRGYQFALRGGFNNLTGRDNPSAVVHNVDSPQFLTFSGLQGRAFVGRIRFLGRK